MTCVSRSGAGRTNAIQRESGDHATSRIASHSSLPAIRRSLPPGRSNSHNSWSLFVCAIHLPSGEGKWIAHTNKDQELWLLDLPGGKDRRIAGRDEWDDIPDVAGGAPPPLRRVL